MPLNDLLQNRRSTRRFYPDAPIARAELNALISQANRAPSSNNAQPWRIMVLTDPALRQRLLPEANHHRLRRAGAVGRPRSLPRAEPAPHPPAGVCRRLL